MEHGDDFKIICQDVFKDKCEGRGGVRVKYSELSDDKLAEIGRRFEEVIKRDLE